MLRPEKRDLEDTELLPRLAQHPGLARVVTLADEFLDLLRKHHPEGLDDWLNNRLKMLKRQMYGWADLDLLAKRFIMAV